MAKADFDVGNSEILLAIKKKIVIFTNEHYVKRENNVTILFYYFVLERFGRNENAKVYNLAWESEKAIKKVVVNPIVNLSGLGFTKMEKIWRVQLVEDQVVVAQDLDGIYEQTILQFIWELEFSCKYWEN